MKCPNCGKEIADDSRFCEFCGTRVEKEEKPIEAVSSESSQKKSLKWLWLLLLIPIFVFVFIIIYDATAYLYVSPSRIEMPCEGGSTTIDVSSNRIWFPFRSNKVSNTSAIINVPANTSHYIKNFSEEVYAQGILWYKYDYISIVQDAAPWPFSPKAGISYDWTTFNGFKWDGMKIIADINVRNMKGKDLYFVVWLRDAKGNYIKSLDSEHRGKNGYACYVVNAKPSYVDCWWKALTFPAIDRAILDIPSGTKCYVTLAVYSASSNKCIGKWASTGWFVK